MSPDALQGASRVARARLQFIPHLEAVAASKPSSEEIFSAFPVGSAPSSLSAGSKLSKGGGEALKEKERGQFELNTLTFDFGCGGEGFSSLRGPFQLFQLQMAVSKKQTASSSLPSPSKKEGQLRDSEKRSF